MSHLYLFSAYPTTNNVLLGIRVNMQQLEKIFNEDQRTTRKCRLREEVDEEDETKK